MPTDPERAAAFAEFYAAHYAAVLAYARRRTDEETARDVTADTFLAAWRRFEDASARGLPWLYRAAANTLRNHTRSTGRGDRLRAKVAAEPVPPVADPAERLGERDRIRRAFDRLRPEDRELLALLAWEDLDQAQVAEALGCTRGATYVRIHRARTRLAAALAQENNPDTGASRPRMPSPKGAHTP